MAFGGTTKNTRMLIFGWAFAVLFDLAVAVAIAKYFAREGTSIIEPTLIIFALMFGAGIALLLLGTIRTWVWYFLANRKLMTDHWENIITEAGLPPSEYAGESRDSYFATIVDNESLDAKVRIRAASLGAIAASIGSTAGMSRGMQVDMAIEGALERLRHSQK